MNTNRKFFIFTTVLLLLFSVAIMINAAFNFRNYSLESTYQKSELVAQIVRDGLTAHMVNGTMDKRAFFLRSIAKTKDVSALWIVRSQKVVKQYGKGLLNERPKDAIDREVLRSGETIQRLNETHDRVIFRITIPYVASAYSEPNCLVCHQVNEGDVLGAISLEFDISDIRQEGILTLVKIGGLTVIFIIIALLAVKAVTRPYVQFFETLQNSLRRARNGDFSLRVETTVQASDIQSVAHLYNQLIEKFQNTVGTIEHKLAILLKSPGSHCQDPLEKASETIELLSDIHRFKLTIEHDETMAQIFDRIANIVRNVMETEHFTLYSVNSDKKRRHILYNTVETLPCSTLSIENALECRAFRTQSEVDSEQFPHLCLSYCGTFTYYFCIPFAITKNFSIIITLLSDSEKKVAHFKERRYTLINYLENAKPVIESRLLMEKLKEKSMRDGLTGVYNRKFLEEFIDQINKQAQRHTTNYAVLMLDIDFFKQVNDTYGHDIGDQFIRLLAQTIQESVRNADIVARYGGEEFVVLLHQSTPEGAKKVAEKIRTAFEKRTIHINGKHIHKTVSVGLSLFPQDAKTLREAIKYADVALYRAKESGRNRVVVFESRMYDEKRY
ncbi:diguanylate cyclase [Hydrogenimonas sp.]